MNHTLSTSAHGIPVTGDIFVDNNTGECHVYDGANWVLLSHVSPLDHDLLSDEYMIILYPDLADLRCDSAEYINLIEKYRTFERIAQDYA